MMFTINLLPCVCVSSHVYVLSSSLARTNPVVDASAGIWVVCLVDIGSHIHLGSMTFADDCRQLTLPIHRWAACIPIWRRCCRHCETVTAMSSSPLPSSCGFHSVATTNTSRRRNYWAAGYTFVLTALHRLIKDHHATIWWNDNITIIINTTSTRFTTVRGTWFPTKVWTKFRTCHGCTQNRLSTKLLTKNPT